MKRCASILLIGGLLMLFSSQAFALDLTALNEEGFESLPLCEEYEEITSTLPEVLQRVNQSIESMYPDSEVRITQDDVDWGKAYKMYIETDIYAAGDDSFQQLNKTLEDTEDKRNSIWQLPISKGDLYFVVDFVIQEPLTDQARSFLSEEEVQVLTQRVGTWCVGSIGFPETADTYPSMLLAALGDRGEEDGRTKVFLGGFSKMRSVVGVALDGQKIESVVPLGYPMASSVPSSRNRSATLQTSGPEEGRVYSFDQMSAYINSLDPPRDNGAAGGVGGVRDPFWTIVLLSVVVFAACVGALLFWGRKTRRI